MKIRYVLMFLMYSGSVMGAGCDDLEDSTISHSFFMPRSVTHDQTFELAMHNYDLFRGRRDLDCWNINFFVSPFYQASVQSETLAKYFFPNQKDEISVREDGLGDVGSLWLGLMTDGGSFFESSVKIRPIRKTYGAYLNMHIDLSGVLQNFWLGITSAWFNARHDVRLQEKLLDDTGIDSTELQTVIDSFNDTRWRHGKLKHRGLSFFGVDDVQIKFGYNLYTDGGGYMGWYITTTIPTGNHITSEYVFEPVVGSRHGSVGCGIKGDFGMSKTSLGSQYPYCSFVNFMFDFKWRYLFSADEMRSFDLTDNGDWSRYLLVSSITQPGHQIPGINEFTKLTSVRPGSQIDLWAAFHCAFRHCNFELGYNFWWRDKDDLKIEETLSNKRGIFDFVSPLITAISASTATIDQGVTQVVVDGSYTSLPADGLNPETGKQPCARTHKVYAAFSYDTCGEHFASLGFGGSYEIARSSIALEQWAIWSSVQVEF